MKNSTTDLKIVREHPARFTWGKVFKITDISVYTIVAFYPTDEPTKTLFHVYVDGDDMSNSCDTIETALLYGMAVKNLGDGNEAGSMARAAAKILGLKIDSGKPS
jgi:hypothetical protein